MPALQAFSISHSFNNGDNLFHDLSCSMLRDRVGLIGRNGIGKSVLLSILTGNTKPDCGEVSLPVSLAIYHQDNTVRHAENKSIAEFVGIQPKLEALRRIEEGDCSAHWFDIVGDDWDLKAKLKAELAALELPQELDLSCRQLSGGQLARLQLWHLFQQDTELLVLDEPSNHLDSRGKQWLIEKIRHFNGAILIASHDRQLLREVEEIWELSRLGLQVYGGNFDTYSRKKQTEQEALERQLADIRKQKKNAEQQAQLNIEKAQQQASQGNKLRRTGGQPKMYLDRQKDKATASAASRNKQIQRIQSLIECKERDLKARLKGNSKQRFETFNKQRKSQTAFSLVDAVLPYGSQKTLNWHVNANQKVHLAGSNGCGKSTLLKVLRGKLALTKGTAHMNANMFYLDQHFGLVCESHSALDNFLNQCHFENESDARILLAGIGMRGEDVFRHGGVLSGGEKMKLAMLIAIHQPDHPFLLLDEPDNYLDLESKRILASALANFQGGFLLISHDLDFVADSGVSECIDFSEVYSWENESIL